MHIFWQKRIVRGDEATPYWFPSQTSGGAIGEGRLVLPIPSGMNWSDQMPRILPEEDPKPEAGTAKQIENAKPAGSKAKAAKPAPARTNLSASVAFFRKREAVEEKRIEKPARAPKPKAKIPPQLVAATRELRDRWMEAVHAGRYLPAGFGKYEVGKRIGDGLRGEAHGPVRGLLRDVA